MTDNQKKLEELLMENIENELGACGRINNVPQTAMALIELWKVTLTENTPVTNVINNYTNEKNDRMSKLDKTAIYHSTKALLSDSCYTNKLNQESLMTENTKDEMQEIIIKEVEKRGLTVSNLLDIISGVCACMSKNAKLERTAHQTESVIAGVQNKN